MATLNLTFNPGIHSYGCMPLIKESGTRGQASLGTQGLSTMVDEAEEALAAGLPGRRHDTKGRIQVGQHRS